MRDVSAIFDELATAARNPEEAVARIKRQGIRVIGCAPYYAPYELVQAAGMQPVELWGGASETSRASSYYPAFYCSVLMTLMERAVRGDYDGLDGVIVPTTCDGLRNLEENWKFAKPEMRVISLVQPANRKADTARRYLVGELKRIAGELEDIAGVKITERALREAIKAHNAQKAAMRRFSEVAAHHLDVVTPMRRHAVYAASRVMPAAAHTALVEELIAALEAQPADVYAGLRIITTGVLIDSEALLSEFEKNGLAVAGDLVIAESGRFSTDAPGRIDPYASIAGVWERVEGVSVALDPRKLRGPMIADMVRERGADGVVMDVLKFCEEEEFDYPVLKQQLAAEGIPLLTVETELQTHMNEQAATRIQAFAEVLSANR